MIRATELAQQLLLPGLTPGAWAVDATVGNGLDTLFLARQVGITGRVFGFEIQAEALAVAGARLTDEPQVTLLHCGHEEFAARLPAEAKGHLAAVMFNLGYLPGAEKQIMTRPETTLAALRQAVEHLQVGGQMTVLLYPGHVGGDEEADAVREFVQALPASLAVSQFRRLNARQPAPELLLVTRQS